MLFRNGVGAGVQVADDRNTQPVCVFVGVFEHLDQFVHHRPIFPSRQIGNDHVGHFRTIQQLANSGNDPLFGNKVDFGAVKSQGGNGGQCVDIIDIFVGDESRFNEIDTGFFFQIQVAGD